MYINGQEDFQKEVLNFNGIALIDCYADWCGPCRMLGPIMEELSGHYQGKNVKIIKIDVDNPNNQSIAGELQVSGIPAVFLFKNGELVDNIVGANPKEVYQDKIDSLLTSIGGIVS